MGTAAASSRTSSAGRHVDWALGERLDGLGGNQFAHSVVEFRPTRRLRHGGADHVLGVAADGFGSLRPLGVKHAGVVAVGLGWPALGDGLPFQAPAFTGCGIALEGLGEALQFVRDPFLHGLGASRELRQYVVGDAAHLGNAVDRLGPLHPQRPAELGPQAGVVDGAQCPLVELDGAGIQSQPPFVVGGHAVGDHHVGVELGVERPAGVLAETGRGDAFGVNGRHLATDAVAGVGVILNPVDHGGDRRVVGLERGVASGVVTQGEEHRHRLWEPSAVTSKPRTEPSP